MKHLQRFVLVVILAIVLSIPSVWAQSPNKQFGMGITVSGGGMTTAAMIGGSSLHFAYAINPAFHVGATFGVEMLEVEDVSYSGFQFGVFGKFLFSGSKELKPFLQGAFGFRSYSVEKASVSTQSIHVSGGAEYFATPNVGIYAGLTPISIQFGDVSATRFGISGGFIGAEWFF